MAAPFRTIYSLIFRLTNLLNFEPLRAAVGLDGVGNLHQVEWHGALVVDGDIGREGDATARGDRDNGGVGAAGAAGAADVGDARSVGI